MTIPFDTNSLDPNSLNNSPQRSLGGVVESGSVTFDSFYEGNVFARWIYIGTSGNLSYQKWDGTNETLPNLVAGLWHPICSIKINSSGTTISADQLRWGS